MSESLNEAALDTLFRTARSYNGWKSAPVSEEKLKAVYALMKWGPTSMNVLPARFLYLASEAAKQRLKPHLASGNVAKTMAAPVCVLIAYDEKFFEQIPKLFPHAPTAGDHFKTDSEAALTSAKLNSTLQAAYFMMAARALGLDCGPMLGFDEAGVTQEFLSGTSYKVNFLCCLGEGDPESLFPRLPRLSFEESCKIL